MFSRDFKKIGHSLSPRWPKCILHWCLPSLIKLSKSDKKLLQGEIQDTWMQLKWSVDKVSYYCLLPPNATLQRTSMKFVHVRSKKCASNVKFMFRRYKRVSCLVLLSVVCLFSLEDPQNQLADSILPKTLLYITTAASERHLQFLRFTWPTLLRESNLLSKVDIVVFSTGDSVHNENISAVFTHVPAFTLIHEPNPGRQEGANLAMSIAVERGILNGYDWVIRLNPDVFILNSSWIFSTLCDPLVDGIFVDCRDICQSGNCNNPRVKVHTDFFAVRPSKLRDDSFSMKTFEKFSNAELTATFEFQDILQSGRHRWLPDTGPMKSSCRVRGKNSPVIHSHSLKFGRNVLTSEIL